LRGWVLGIVMVLTIDSQCHKRASNLSINNLSAGRTIASFVVMVAVDHLAIQESSSMSINHRFALVATADFLSYVYLDFPVYCFINHPIHRPSVLCSGMKCVK
jgi:hypothetical protein